MLNKKEVRGLTMLLACVYMVSYLTRINYGTIISAMVTQTGFTKDSLSLALTGSFITYGAGQIVSGIMGDRMNPKKLISCGLAVTVAMNILLPFCGSPWLMCAVWCINGFAQSFMWPPIVRMMSHLLSERDYQNSSVRVSWGGSIGTILLYLLSPMILAVLPWKWVFWICALGGAVMLIVWRKSAPDVPPVIKEKRSRRDRQPAGRVISPLIIAVMAAIALQGMLRDGVTTWMPSYISETYHLSNGTSILSGVLLPLFGLVSFRVASCMYGGKLKSPVACAAIIFAVGAFAALGLFLLNGTSAIGSILLSALLTGCMHGAGFILICMIPPFFKAQGNVSTVSGILNASTYIGSALSTYGIARLSDSIGWNSTVFIWFLIAFSGVLLCALCIPKWKKEFCRDDNGCAVD